MLASNGSIITLTSASTELNKMSVFINSNEKELRQSRDQKISSEQMSAMMILVTGFGTTHIENPTNVDVVSRLTLVTTTAMTKVIST